MWEVEELDARTYSPADARAIADLICIVWPKPDKPVDVRQHQLLTIARGYHGAENQHPRSFVIREAGQVIAHSGVIPRNVGTSRGDMTIAGLARVCSNPAYRGKGLGEIVVRKVFDLVDKGIFAFSLFQTSHQVSPFYEKLGAVPTTNLIVNSHGSDPAANPFWDEVVLRYPKNRDWPKGKIDLRGPAY
jgi:predicted N-acetyltransferase YhbS